MDRGTRNPIPDPPFNCRDHIPKSGHRSLRKFADFLRERSCPCLYSHLYTPQLCVVIVGQTKLGNERFVKLYPNPVTVMGSRFVLPQSTVRAQHLANHRQILQQVWSFYISLLVIDHIY
jgi:hypothetical protein